MTDEPRDMRDHLMPDERSQNDVEMDETTRRLHGTTDAMVWAQEWCRIAREIEVGGGSAIDEGWMVGWFANAMEIAAAFQRRRIADELPNTHGRGSGHPRWCEACAVARAVGGPDSDAAPAKSISVMICEACGADPREVLSIRYEHEGDDPPVVEFTTSHLMLAGPPDQVVERYTLTPIEG